MLSTGQTVQKLKLVKKENPLTNDVFLLSASVNGVPLFVQSVTSCICKLFRIESIRIMSVL